LSRWLAIIFRFPQTLHVENLSTKFIFYNVIVYIAQPIYLLMFLDRCS